jgi:gas vesicle protein
MMKGRETSMSTSSVGIRDGIAHTREQLADTAETLGHKVEVPAGVMDKWHATKDTVQAKIGQVAQHLHNGKETVQDKADEVTQQATSLINQARAQVPAPVRGRVHQVAQSVRQRPAGNTAAAVVFAVLVLLLLRRLFHTAE